MKVDPEWDQNGPTIGIAAQVVQPFPKLPFTDICHYPPDHKTAIENQSAFKTPICSITWESKDSAKLMTLRT